MRYQNKLAFAVLGMSILLHWIAAPAWSQQPSSSDVGQPSLTKEFREKLLPPESESINTMGAAPEPRSMKPPELDIRIPFELNQHQISPKAAPYLKSLGEALTDKDLKGYVFEIQGHTCSLGSDERNLELSRKRAASVKEYLVSFYPISPARIRVEGYGKKIPRADNKTEEGRQQNRRVTVVNTLEPFAEQEARLYLKTQVKFLRGKEAKDVRPGETLTSRDNYCVSFIPETECHVYVFQVGSDSNIQLLFPNPKLSERSNPVKPGELHRIPGRADLWLHLDDGRGDEEIVVVATPRALEKPEIICRRIMGTPTMLADADTQQQVTTMGYQGVRSSSGSPSRPGAVARNEQPPDHSESLQDHFTWRIRFHHQ